MHLVDRIHLPTGYTARPYVGASDHPAMTPVLAAYREHLGDPQMPTVEYLDVGYAHLDDCDPTTDIALIEHGGSTVAYLRPHRHDPVDGVRDGIVFSPTIPEHLAIDLFTACVDAQERHLAPWMHDRRPARYRAYAAHPGPDRSPTGEAAWLEELGYRPTEWEASLVRPNLDDIPERDLPPGVELRPVRQDQIRQIWDAHIEAFRDEWDYREPTEAQFEEFVEDPCLDPSLWKIAWAGDTVVGQVKSFINHDENEARGYRRGYTEDISVHRGWRNRGIAGTLLARSLRALSDRGMTEAALGVDTNNPGGAFQLYTSLGFELQHYEAIYTKPLPTIG